MIYTEKIQSNTEIWAVFEDGDQLPEKISQKKTSMMTGLFNRGARDPRFR
jgi:hypothetical protein